MENCTESHQSEINRKIKTHDKVRTILTALPAELRELIYGDAPFSFATMHLRGRESPHHSGEQG